MTYSEFDIRYHTILYRSGATHGIYAINPYKSMQLVCSMAMQGLLDYLEPSENIFLVVDFQDRCMSEEHCKKITHALQQDTITMFQQILDLYRESNTAILQVEHVQDNKSVETRYFKQETGRLRVIIPYNFYFGLQLDSSIKANDIQQVIVGLFFVVLAANRECLKNQNIKILNIDEVSFKAHTSIVEDNAGGVFLLTDCYGTNWLKPLLHQETEYKQYCNDIMKHSIDGAMLMDVKHAVAILADLVESYSIDEV